MEFTGFMGFLGFDNAIDAELEMNTQATLNREPAQQCHSLSGKTVDSGP